MGKMQKCYLVHRLPARGARVMVLWHRYSFVRKGAYWSGALWLLGSLGLAVAGTGGDWVLRGTLIYGPDVRFAILQDARKGEEKILREGSSLPSGEFLLRVSRDSVVVRSATGEYRLRFGASLAASAREGPAIPKVVPVKRGALQQLSSDLPALMEQVQIAPHKENGRVAGYAIRSLNEQGIGAELGLQKGDIITNVNGIALDEQANGWKLYGQFKDEPSITVDLIRDGNPMTLDFRLR